MLLPPSWNQQEPPLNGGQDNYLDHLNPESLAQN